jgi:hypothetical protein
MIEAPDTELRKQIIGILWEWRHKISEGHVAAVERFNAVDMPHTADVADRILALLPAGPVIPVEPSKRVLGAPFWISGRESERTYRAFYAALAAEQGAR